MKRAAILAVAVVLCALVLLVYGVVHTRLDITPLPAKAFAAADQPQEFERLRRAVDTRSLIGTAFQQVVDGEARDYSLVVFTVQLKNNGLLPADMAEVVVAPAEGDVLCYMEGTTQGTIPNNRVAPGETISLRCVLLTKGPQTESIVRNLYVSYHIWGNPFQVRVLHGRQGAAR